LIAQDGQMAPPSVLESYHTTPVWLLWEQESYNTVVFKECSAV